MWYWLISPHLQGVSLDLVSFVNKHINRSRTGVPLTLQHAFVMNALCWISFLSL